MELVIAGIVGGIFLALVLWRVIYSVVGSAVDNLFAWLILTLGNDDAVARLKGSPEHRHNDD